MGSLYAVMQFFGGPFLAGLSDRTGRRPVLVVCLLGASLSYALLGLAETLTLVVAAVALAGAAGGTQATAQAFVADSTPPEDRAKGLGLFVLPESLPEERRSRTPLLRLDPVTGLVRTLRMGDTGPLLLAVLLLNLAFTGFLNYKPARG